MMTTDDPRLSYRYKGRKALFVSSLLILPVDYKGRIGRIAFVTSLIGQQTQNNSY
jgi:hypothetical protein